MFLCKCLFYGGKRTQAVALCLSAGSQPQIFSPPQSTNGCPEALAWIEWNDFYLCIIWPIPKWKWCHNIISFKLLSSHSLFNLFNIARLVLYAQATITGKFLWSIQCNNLSAPVQWLKEENDLAWQTDGSHCLKKVVRHWGFLQSSGVQQQKADSKICQATVCSCFKPTQMVNIWWKPSK